MILLTEEEYLEYVDTDAGYCTTCNDVTSFDGVEPDAENYECHKCGKLTLMGIENAMVCGHIEIKEEEE